jgi:hypothetical protein
MPPAGVSVKNTKLPVQNRLLMLVLGALVQLLAATVGAQERNFSNDPPRIERATVQLIEKPTGLGNALVEVVIARGEQLPLQVPIYLEQSRVVLRDDGMAGDRVVKDGIYSVILPFDLLELGRNQERVRKLLDRYGNRLAMPVYRGRARVGRAVPAEESLRPLQPGVRVPLEWWGFDVAVDAGKSLLIRDLAVVQDPQRTYDPCTGTGTPMGSWTFGHLMTQLANPAVTGLDPENFVEQWIQTFLATQTVNGFDVFPRPQVQALVLDHWPKTPSGQLDLVRAPFKLLAIVNRVDLRGNSVYGGGDAGEARFVFGLARCANGVATSSDPQMTIIFEYGIGKNSCQQVRAWGQQWVELGDLVLGSPQYNDALQAITDQFSLAGAAPTRPNQSALNQLRSNGGMSDALWQFREFKLSSRGVAGSRLLPATVAQTPDSDVMPEFVAGFGYPNPTALADFVNLHAASIVADQHSVPLNFAGVPFRGASSSRHGVPYGWNSALITNREARHKFALQTCNGCHFNETATTSGSQEFFHVLPVTNGPAALSGFMTGIDVVDPFDGAPMRHFDELERRATDLDGLANNSCLSAVDTRRRLPVTFAH